MSGKRFLLAATVLAALAALGLPARADGHCDALDGPVVADARIALEKGDVTAVLKWVKKEDEAEIRAAFRDALTVRGKGAEAKALADRYFFETLIRVHRAGEGAPYTGLKPAGAELGPAVVGSDKALEMGSVDSLVKLVTDAAAAGIRTRFQQAMETKKHAAESVDGGRKFVAAYVEFMHYSERLYDDAQRYSGHDHPAVHSAEGVGEHADGGSDVDGPAFQPAPEESGERPRRGW